MLQLMDQVDIHRIAAYRSKQTAIASNYCLRRGLYFARFQNACKMMERPSKYRSKNCYSQNRNKI